MTKLVELREKLSAKRKEYGRVWEEAGDDFDFNKVTSLGDVKGSVAIVEWVQAREKELADLQTEIVQLDEYKAIAERNAAELKSLNEPVPGFVHPLAGAQSIMGQPAVKSWSQKVIESDVIKSYDKSRHMSPTVELEALDLIGTKTLLTETGYAPQAVRTGLVLPFAFLKPVVADLLPQGTTDQIAIVYMEETTATNAAAGVAEGIAKPESTLVFTEKSSPVRKIATLLPVTDELIADVPAMQSYLEGRLRLFLKLAEDSAILIGDGIAPNLLGLINVVGINTQARGADPNEDAVYKAMVKIETTAFIPASGVVFNPLNWQTIRLHKTADGIYIWGSPSETGPATIWGLPVVTTPTMTLNSALVGAFDAATMMFRRTGVEFAISDQHGTFFAENKLMLRVEERAAVVCFRPLGLSTVTGLN